jgi:hypothetical protein
MATINDKKNIKKAMEECKEHPLQCCWVGNVSISYSDSIDKYIAIFDCDLTVVFDYVTYSSNTIFFNSKNDDYAVAHITHKGLS